MLFYFFQKLQCNVKSLRNPWIISAKIPTFTNYNTTLNVNDTKQGHYFTSMLHCCACTYISVHQEVWFCCKLSPANDYSTEREREWGKKTKLFTPSLSPWNICVYCEYQNKKFFFSFMRLLRFFFFSNKTKFKGILITELWVTLLFFERILIR